MFVPFSLPSSIVSFALHKVGERCEQFVKGINNFDFLIFLVCLACFGHRGNCAFVSVFIGFLRLLGLFTAPNKNRIF